MSRRKRRKYARYIKNFYFEDSFFSKPVTPQQIKNIAIEVFGSTYYTVNKD